MEHAAARAVHRVIQQMHARVSEPFSIEDMAGVAMFSKFHFSRIFQDITGVSPGRFLYAVRLMEAKRLLLTTSLSITEVSVHVGYTSVGTFSTRFKRSVGMPPSEFRLHRGRRPWPLRAPPRPGPAAATVGGGVLVPPACPRGPVVLGVFPDPICDGPPVRCLVLPGEGPFVLAGVPAGRWHLLGCLAPDVDAGHPNVHRGHDHRAGGYRGHDHRAGGYRGARVHRARDRGAPGPEAAGGTAEPRWRGAVSFTARVGQVVEDVRLRLRLPMLADPPILSAMPDVAGVPGLRPVVGLHASR